MFSVISCEHGSVETYDDGRCFRTADDDSQGYYENLEVCYIYVSTNCALNVHRFQLEPNFDFLHYGSESWTGNDGPEDWTQVQAGNKFMFESDSYITLSGFDICCVEETWELRGGDSDDKGNVLLNGQPICDYEWGTEEANVVCRILGFDRGEPTCCSRFGMLDDYNFIMYHVYCGGYENSIWDCEYIDSEIRVCNESSGAGLECFDALEEAVAIVGTIVLLLLICCCCLGCVGCYCCWRSYVKQNQKNNQVRVEMQTAGNQNVGNVVLNPVQAVAANNLVSDRVGVASKPVAVVRPVRETYQPKSTNTFSGYHRSSDNDGQIEGAGQNNGSIPLTNYEVPVQPGYNPQDPSAPPPPAWNPPPAYAPPAYDTTSY